MPTNVHECFPSQPFFQGLFQKESTFCADMSTLVMWYYEFSDHYQCSGDDLPMAVVTIGTLQDLATDTVRNSWLADVVIKNKAFGENECLSKVELKERVIDLCFRHSDADIEVKDLSLCAFPRRSNLKEIDISKMVDVMWEEVSKGEEKVSGGFFLQWGTSSEVCWPNPSVCIIDVMACISINESLNENKGTYYLVNGSTLQMFRNFRSWNNTYLKLIKQMTSRFINVEIMDSQPHYRCSCHNCGFECERAEFEDGHPFSNGKCQDCQEGCSKCSEKSERCDECYLKCRDSCDECEYEALGSKWRYMGKTMPKKENGRTVYSPWLDLNMNLKSLKGHLGILSNLTVGENVNTRMYRLKNLQLSSFIQVNDVFFEPVRILENRCDKCQVKRQKKPKDCISRIIQRNGWSQRQAKFWWDRCGNSNKEKEFYKDSGCNGLSCMCAKQCVPCKCMLCCFNRKIVNMLKPSSNLKFQWIETMDLQPMIGGMPHTSDMKIGTNESLTIYRNIAKRILNFAYEDEKVNSLSEDKKKMNPWDDSSLIGDKCLKGCSISMARLDSSQINLNGDTYQVHEPATLKCDFCVLQKNQVSKKMKNEVFGKESDGFGGGRHYKAISQKSNNFMRLIWILSKYRVKDFEFDIDIQDYESCGKKRIYEDKFEKEVFQNKSGRCSIK